MEFANVGKHCEEPSCRQQDFLPFKCDACEKTFCLSHRTYRTHNCAKAGTKDTVGITCPLCAKVITLRGDEDPNAAWEAHSKSECDPKSRKKRTKKPRCAKKGCREKLVFSNKVTCPKCHLDLCLEHRYEDAHDCAAVARASRSTWLDAFATPSRATGASASGVSRGAGASSARKPTARRPQSAAARAAAARAARNDPMNTVRGTADRRRRGAPAATATASASAVAPPPAPAATMPSAAIAATSGPERCPTCGARFGTVEELVFHSEAFHPSGSDAPMASAAAPVVDLTGAGAGATAPAPRAPAPARGARARTEPCPQCGQRFDEAMMLVAHMEAVHRRALTEESQQRTCAVS